MTTATPTAAPTLPPHATHSVAYGDYVRTWTTPADTQRRWMQELANKSVEEQKQIFLIKIEIANHIKTRNSEQIQKLREAKKSHPAYYDYVTLLMAVQLHDADCRKSEFVSEIREARQDIKSFQKSPIKEVIKSLMPLIENLKAKGATWAEITKIVNTKKRKILSNRKISQEYLKKTYYKIKKDKH